MASSQRVQRLRRAIEDERQRQNECNVYLGASKRRLTSCKQSPTTRSVIRVASTTSIVSRRGRARACDWQSSYQLERGDWAAPVRVDIACVRSDGKEQTRQRIAAARIATWCWRQRVRAKVQAQAFGTIETLPSQLAQHKLQRQSPREVLRRIQAEIAAKATFQIQTRAARVLQRFFSKALLRLGKKSHVLVAEASRKQRQLDSMKRDRAVRYIQAMYRNRQARQQHSAWKVSRSKANYCRIMVLEAEYNGRPSAIALLQLSRAYAELASQPVYADEQLLLARCSLLFVSKAIAFGHVPENPRDFWPALAARFVDLWRRGGHVEIPLLQQAAHAYETALALTPSASEMWLAYIEVLFELGLYCQTLKACDQYARTLEHTTAGAPRRRRHARPIAIWRFQVQSYYHVGDVDAALGLLEDQRQESHPQYSSMELLLLLTRCHDVAKPLCHNPYYDELLHALYSADDITRHELTPEMLVATPGLFTDLALTCAARRDFPWAVDLLECSLRGVDRPSHDHLHALAQSYFGVGNLKKCATVLLRVRGSATTAWFAQVQRHATLFEAQHRISVLHLRRELHVAL
ncbi:hypothetical protein SPRG_01894 [Saprolegnia parasitica CBS 223.65]|uniref:Uncharacterized protein n=1 Tax=Saprolegnia parasitica (strain CBS 223.65) TaxID=695850 RepID=A0A067CQV2_SAPPC|nr:hypothetical protein SPRG_01894 [Saprolegnia parasitica CBS 223.65]KDO33079.1 hypothetical protein SPRG_01894 [Saprolegnia parasitica CBS 223.65]|eukprot:XP_012195850.1 hypothetical protein SPRG_01894 [Saprolegnia parasitica CBS 223.65]